GGAPFLGGVGWPGLTCVRVPPVGALFRGAAGGALIVNESVAPAEIVVIVPGIGGAGRSKRRISCKAASRRELRFLPTLRVEKTTSSSAGGSLTKMRLQGRLTN